MRVNMTKSTFSKNDLIFFLSIQISIIQGYRVEISKFRIWKIPSANRQMSILDICHYFYISSKPSDRVINPPPKLGGLISDLPTGQHYPGISFSFTVRNRILATQGTNPDSLSQTQWDQSDPIASMRQNLAKPFLWREEGSSDYRVAKFHLRHIDFAF